MISINLPTEKPKVVIDAVGLLIRLQSLLLMAFRLTDVLLMPSLIYAGFLA